MPYIHGTKIFDNVTSDGTDTTIYSSKFTPSRGSVWAAHVEWDDDASSYTATVTLWASCKPVPGESDDTDWVEMTSSHGWDGFPKDPTGGDDKDLADVGISGALHYRFKVARTAGSATWNGWVVCKDEV